MKNTNKYKYQEGQLLLFTFVLMTIITVIIVALVGYASTQMRAHKQGLGRTIGLDIAEAGAEMAIWKLNNQIGYTGEVNTTYGGGVYTIAVTNVTSSMKTIRVDSYVPNATNPIAHRVIQINATTGTTNIGFNYGVQAGQGGIKMDNNSTINGNIYSNGTIIGDNNAVTITGTAISAGPTGKIDEVDNIGANAVAHFIEDSGVAGDSDSYSLVRTSVGGNATATTMSNCDITGNAVYDTRSSCTVDGSSTSPNPQDFMDPMTVPLPITDEQVVEWENEALEGGTVGSQTISGISTSLGPKKVNGDLILINNATLTVTGTLWVTGNIILNNGTTLKLHPGYGSLSGTIIAGVFGNSTAGFIDAQNGAIIQGSGTAGSNILLLSQRNNTTAVAINVANNAAGAVFYAGYGVLDVYNNAQGKELTAYKIHLNQGTVITYESGLASSQFTSGPGGGWEIQEQTWQLIQ